MVHNGLAVNIITLWLSNQWDYRCPSQAHLLQVFDQSEQRVLGKVSFKTHVGGREDFMDFWS